MMDHHQSNAQARHPPTADGRQFGTTDDVAIFMDDTFDMELTKCVTNSPSAMAILSPQRMPVGSASGSGGKNAYVDVTEYDPQQMLAGYQAGMSSSARKHRRAFASDITNGGVRLTFGAERAPGRPCTSSAPGATDGASTSLNTSSASLPPPQQQPSASAALIAAQQVELERLEKERNRYCKMYEHQKALYEEMAQKQHETHQRLQEKIVEVVALSTRNEESKRFIRQLKREMLDCKTRTLDLHNKALDDLRVDRAAEDKYEAMMRQQELQFNTVVEEMQGKMAGLESLVKDLTAMHRDSPSTRVQIGQLDMLLRAAYAKNAALFGDLFKQGRMLELTAERKIEAERIADALRREKRDADISVAAERRRIAAMSRQHADHVLELQQTVQDLRQLLVRTLDVTDSSGSSEESGDDCLPAAVRPGDDQRELEDERYHARPSAIGIPTALAMAAPPLPDHPSHAMYHRPQRRMLAVPATPPHCAPMSQ
jgi:hypothetical protein